MAALWLVARDEQNGWWTYGHNSDELDTIVSLVKKHVKIEPRSKSQRTSPVMEIPAMCVHFNSLFYYYYYLLLDYDAAAKPSFVGHFDNVCWGCRSMHFLSCPLS